MASTILSSSLQTRTQVAGIATVSIAAVAYFVVVLVALHFLRPDVNPISRPTSEYAFGPDSIGFTLEPGKRYIEIRMPHPIGMWSLQAATIVLYDRVARSGYPSG